MQPPPLDAEQIAAAYGDRLGHVRTCRSGCGELTRQAHHMTYPELLLDVDAMPSASGDYWHPRIGWRPQVAGIPHDLPLYAAHLCPALTNTSSGRHDMTMFGTPRTASEGVTNNDLQNHPLLITVTEMLTNVETSSGIADRVLVADIVLLDTGDEHPGNWLFGKVLTSQLEVGTQYVGFIGKGVAKQGKSAPWVFTASPEHYDTAGKYLAHKASSTPAPAPSPTAAPAFNPAAAAAAPQPTSVIAPPWAS